MKSAINPRSKSFRRTLLGGSLALALAVTGGAAFVTRWQQVTEVPALAFSSQEYQPPTSVLTAPLEIDLSALTMALNEKVPASLKHQWKDSVRLEKSTGIPRISCHRWKCRKKGEVKIKVDVPYEGDARVTRPGPVELVGHGEALEVRVPLAFWVRISGRGSLGGHVHETAEGWFVLSTRLRATLREDWSLAFAASPTIEWQGAPGGKLFNLVPYTIRSLVEEKLNDKMQDLVADLEKQANTQLALRANADKLWLSAFATHRIPGELPAWAVITPQKVAWSPLSFNRNTITSALQLSLGTAVVVSGQPPAAPAPTVLPKLTTIGAPKSGEVKLHTPVRVSYSSLSAYAMDLAATMPSLSRAGIAVKDVQFYPAGERIAVRVEAAVDVPGHWFDTRAVIHLAGKPAIDAASGELSLQRVTLNRTFDNAFVDAIEVPLHQLIEDTLASKLKADLQPVIAGANRRIATNLAPLKQQGAVLSASIDHVTLGDTHLMKDSLVFPVQIEGSVETKLDVSRFARN